MGMTHGHMTIYVYDIYILPRSRFGSGVRGNGRAKGSVKVRDGSNARVRVGIGNMHWEYVRCGIRKL